MDDSRVEVGPPGLSQARKRLASIVCWASALAGLLAGVATYLLLVFLAISFLGGGGFFAAVILGAPVGYAAGVVTGGLLDYFIVIGLLKVIERADQGLS